jgi:hypothetical protein
LTDAVVDAVTDAPTDAPTDDPIDRTGFQAVPTTTLADLLGREQIMDIGVRPLWPAIRRVNNPAEQYS